MSQHWTLRPTRAQLVCRSHPGQTRATARKKEKKKQRTPESIAEMVARCAEGVTLRTQRETVWTYEKASALFSQQRRAYGLH